MKTKIKYLIIALIMAALSGLVTTNAKAQGSVSFQIFYDELDPYGQWINYPSYGYVWVPYAGPEFMPYSSGGYWVWTDFGWTWVSNYDWGWAPFHYGRWDYVDYYGWVWIPGNEWGPAWVVWRNSPGYYGWAPLAPGISINVAIGGGYYQPADHWIFVNNQYMGNRDIHYHYGPRTNNQNLINNSTVIRNTYVDNSRHTTYITGPRGDEVQKITGRQIKPVAVRENGKPGQSLRDNQLNIYRPQVSKGQEAKARPARVAEKKDVPPPAQRKQLVKPSQPVQRNNNTNQPARNTPEKREQPANRTNPAPQQKRNETKPVQRERPVQREKPVEQKSVPQPRPVQREKPANQPPPQQRPPQQERRAPVNPPPQRREQPQPQQPRQQPQQQPRPQNVQPPVQRPPVQQPQPAPQQKPQRPPRN